MRQRQVQCPICNTLLNVPLGCSDRLVRCGMCQHRFRLPANINVTEDSIAEWLGQDLLATEDQETRAAEALAAQQGPISGETAVLPAVTDLIRLVQLDKKGALFEFSAKRLKDVNFRCAFHKCCIRCGTKAHLHPHVIIFAQRLVDSFSMEAERSAGSPTAGRARLMHLRGAELLEQFPEVPDVPPPGNLPMPYWICDMCSGTGMISGQIQINEATGKGVCRLLIRNLRRAEEFLINTGGRNTQDHVELAKRIAASITNAWENLPESVQHRVGTWYRPDKDEQFVAYIPDRDRTRSEDGMSGVVISNQRLIYHTQFRHQQADIAEPIELQLTNPTSRFWLRIKTAGWEAKNLTVDREGIALLRRALTLAKFKATWC